MPRDLSFDVDTSFVPSRPVLQALNNIEASRTAVSCPAPAPATTPTPAPAPAPNSHHVTFQTGTFARPSTKPEAAASKLQRTELPSRAAKEATVACTMDAKDPECAQS
jgi:hypothetical protein